MIKPNKFKRHRQIFLVAWGMLLICNIILFSLNPNYFTAGAIGLCMGVLIEKLINYPYLNFLDKILSSLFSQIRTMIEKDMKNKRKKKEVK